ncbi:hypothetical protein [Streptomyces sp. NBC_01803]|uniref:hypothetical protein n=1 Tax=Streptomyces sp. NBC_01803 TaxID=2975946 RepID=UPI002DDC1B5E|nr:hypothetical protein [Streptomyces sp. NBC_01803]WSA42937.1 hypothetical protein OIE51_01185 [Streptomyces sp. NBC_01803]
MAEYNAEDRIAIARTYFEKVDAGDPTLLDVFTDAVQVYFPKIGTAGEKGAAIELIRTLTTAVREFVHDKNSMIFTYSGDRLAVEGNEGGVLSDGTVWPQNGKSEGSYCNILSSEET